MLKEEPWSEPLGKLLPHPIPCACQADPAFCLRPAAGSGTWTRGSDSRDNVWDGRVFQGWYPRRADAN